VIHFDLASIERQLEELHGDMSSPGFWDDVDRANEVNKKIRNLEAKANSYKKLKSRADDASVMMELAFEHNDAESQEMLEGVLGELFDAVDAFRLTTVLKGRYDGNNAILSLHAGAGGTESQDWVQMLYRMYTRYCERKGYTVKVLDYLPGDEAGIKNVSFLAEGDNAYGFLKAEKGVHRLVRISPFDSNARRHTSFASLDVMPEVDDIDEVEIRPEDLKVDTFHSSGAGGQHVNKTESAVRITHIPTGFVVACQNERSQMQNREVAMRMLMSKLVEKQEQERREEMARVKGEVKKIEWGSQIRSYVFCPYTMVKDHRTEAETSNVDAVMDGDLDLFINEYLRQFKE
jgi:peptide chain release factor 2